jgi:hypothetical protein
VALHEEKKGIEVTLRPPSLFRRLGEVAPAHPMELQSRSSSPQNTLFLPKFSYA